MRQKKNHIKHKSSLPLVDTELLRQKLKLKNLQTRADFAGRYKTASNALKELDFDLTHLRRHSGKIITAGALTGTLLLAVPAGRKVLTAPKTALAKAIEPIGHLPALSKRTIVVNSLNEILPESHGPLTREQEKHLEQVYKENIGIAGKATLEGEHLNTTYGLIGAEQHLRRYPGDSLKNHGSIEDQAEGIAPGLGAWGYFAPRKEELTEDLVETEKWYAVVQTMYVEGWNTRQPHLKNWYKYRKVLIVNTDNGKAIVASIADSGPAMWTGKNFGGSPEVMNYLGGQRYKKGPVTVFFVDDPDNTVPLGPVEYNNV
jgi:hypothetical protein